MILTHWIGWLLLSAAALGLSLWHYRRRETPGRGRALLAVLRACTLALVLLLLFDPRLPGGAVAPGTGMQVLLDASLSMTLTADPAAAGAVTPWQLGVDSARARAGGRPILLFGSSVRAVTSATLPDSAPADARSSLLPALQAAAESGARRALVITDGRIDDADAVARWAVRLGLEIETAVVGSEVANRALIEASAPAWIEAGEAAEFEFAVAGASGDSVRVVARQDGRTIGRAAVAPVGAGRLATGSMALRLQPPPDGGWVAVELALEAEDGVPDDDVRTVYVRVAAEPAAIALVSFRPDWEPRFLAPVLEQALGLPLRAYLRGATGQYVRLAGGLEAGVAASEEDVRGAVERAALLVLHGLGPDAPAWAADAAAGRRPVLIFPGQDAAGAAAAVDLGLPVAVGDEQAGDYFPSGPVPSSPIAALLADLALPAVSPLAGLRPVVARAGSWAPLLVTRGRQGAPLPVIVAGDDAGRRWAVALASGYWLWAFRGDVERQVYTRLWGALAGWLTQDGAAASFAAVRPASLALPRATAIPWITPGMAPDSLRITVNGADDAVVYDTVVAPAAGDTAYTEPPPPGAYSYRARAFSGNDSVAAAGLFTVERYSPEFARPRADLDALVAGTSAVRGERARASGKPLHASAYPYVLLLLLLAAEWILRRRWGLR